MFDWIRREFWAMFGKDKKSEPLPKYRFVKDISDGRESWYTQQLYSERYGSYIVMKGSLSYDEAVARHRYKAIVKANGPIEVLETSNF